MKTVKQIILDAAEHVFENNDKIAKIVFSVNDYECNYLNDDDVLLSPNSYLNDKYFYALADIKNSLEFCLSICNRHDFQFKKDLENLNRKAKKAFDDYFKKSGYGLHDYFSDELTKINMLDKKERVLFFKELNLKEPYAYNIIITRELKMIKKKKKGI